MCAIPIYRSVCSIHTAYLLIQHGCGPSSDIAIEPLIQRWLRALRAEGIACEIGGCGDDRCIINREGLRLVDFERR